MRHERTPLTYSAAELEAQMPVRYGRMRFASPLEEEFRREYALEGQKARLWMLCIPLALFVLAATVGSQLYGTPERLLSFTTPANWALVLCITLALIVIRTPRWRQYADAVLIAIGFVIGIVMTASGIFARQAGMDIPDGLGIIYLSALLILARITFRRAVVTTGLVILIMLLLQISFYGMAQEVKLRYLEQVLLLAISAAGGWLLELNSRTLWLKLRILEAVSHTDPLTGIPNRRGFEESLNSLLRFASRERRPITLLLIDLDFFKGLNDHYGHEYGDHALRTAAQFLRGTIRRALDLCGRYGGEEFVVVLFDCQQAAAEARCRDLVVELERLGVENAGSKISRHLTCSVGAVCFQPGQGTQLAQVLRRADENLYQAKHDGRNRFVMSEIKQAETLE